VFERAVYHTATVICDADFFNVATHFDPGHTLQKNLSIVQKTSRVILKQKMSLEVLHFFDFNMFFSFLR